MTTLASLRILLGLDSGGVKSGAANVKGDLKAVQQEANNTNATLRNIGKGVVAGFGLGAGLGAFQATKRAIGEVTDFLKDSVQGAIEEQAEIRQLTQSLITNVPAWDRNSDAIERRISAGEQLAFSDSEQRTSLAALAGALHDVGEAFKFQSLAMDLARFKGESLATATDELIKVQAGSFRSLKSLGIELQAGATSAEAFGAIQKVVAGQSQAFAETTEAKMTRADQSIKNLQEDIGTGLLPVIGDLAEALDKVLGGRSKGLAAQAGDFVSTATIAQIKAARDGVAQDLADMGPNIIDVGGVHRAATEVLEVLDKALAEANNGLSEGARFGGEYAKSLSLAAQAAKANAVAVGEATVASLSFGDEQLRVSRATVDASTAHADLTDALKDAQAAGSGDAAAMADLAAAEATDQAATDELTAAKKALKDAQDAVTAAAALQVYQALNASDAWKTYKDSLSGAQFTAGQLIADLITLNGMHVEATIDLTIGQGGNVEAVADATGVFAGIVAKQASDAKAAADEIARAYRDKLGSAFDAVKESAHRFFDDLHQHNLDAITDIHDVANAALSEQEKAIRGVVDAERARVDAMRNARQLESLRANVASAKPEDRAGAQRALGDFLADQRIAALSGQADTQIAALEAEKAKNDALAAAAVTAENERNTAQVAAFDNDLARLQKSLSEHPKAWATTQQEILKLLMGYGVDYKKAAQSLGDQFAAGLLSKTRAAEEAAAALAGAAGGPLGVTPRPAGIPAAAGGIPAAVAGVTAAPIELVIHNHIYLDGNEVMDFVDRRLASTANRVTSGGIGG